MTRSLHASEDQIHVAVAQWLDLTYPQTPDDVEMHGVCWTTIEHKTSSEAEGRDRKRRGVKPGIPDLDFIYDGFSFRIELKNHNRPLSDDQVKMRLNMIAAGADWALCRSLEEVIAQLGVWDFPPGVRRVVV